PTLAAILLAGVLSACTTVGPNFHSPSAPAESGYAMAGDATTPLAAPGEASRDWWRSLRSPGLDRLMAEALAGNQTLARADANLDAARFAERAVAGGLKPQVDANASLARERINTQAFGITGFPSPTLSLYTVGGSVSYDLDLFGGGRRRLEEARAQLEASSERAGAAWIALTGQTALAAVQIATIENRLAAVSQIIADDKTNLDLIARAQKAGAEAPSASNVGQAQLAADEAMLPPLDQALAKQRHALALLVGRPPGGWTAPQFTLADFTIPGRIPVSVPSELVENRPDIRAAEAEVHAATAAVGVAEAARYPDIRLTASIAQEALSPAKLFSFASTAYSLGPSLTAPIFHGGALKADQRQAQAAARAAVDDWRQTVLSAFVQVADVLSSLGEDQAQLKALESAEAVGASALKDARTAYRLGGGTLLDVVTQERRLAQTRLQLADAEGARLGDVVQLYAATAARWRP
ncbi:MAG: efflux transporter outer membrane subunit, partial [Caulobacteraceae bacterium]